MASQNRHIQLGNHLWNSQVFIISNNPLSHEDRTNNSWVNHTGFIKQQIQTYRFDFISINGTHTYSWIMGISPILLVIITFYQPWSTLSPPVMNQKLMNHHLWLISPIIITYHPPPFLWTFPSMFHRVSLSCSTKTCALPRLRVASGAGARGREGTAALLLHVLPETWRIACATGMGWEVESWSTLS